MLYERVSIGRHSDLRLGAEARGGLVLVYWTEGKMLQREGAINR